MTAEFEGRAAADRFRLDHHLGTQPLGDLGAIIEQATGIDVAVIGVGPDEHGLTMRDPNREAVFIAVARTRHPMRQRSTLAHELAHVLFADWDTVPAVSPATRSPEEIRADAFARHLLAPASGLREMLGSRDGVGPAILSQVVQRFLVSPVIAAITLHDAGYISAATKAEWGQLTTPTIAARFGWGDQYRALQGESDQRRAPQRLLTRAVEGYRQNIVSVQTIASLRGMDVETVEGELRDAGVEPLTQPVVWSEPSALPEVRMDLDDLDGLDEHAGV